ncbi:hypothetical protein EDB84DRAFT_1435041 [Lactarius hengduanensis]|nr:hypothetical protein EDB84DRAFT_1435041 [Lactarius hengduanensis]
MSIHNYKYDNTLWEPGAAATGWWSGGSVEVAVAPWRAGVWWHGGRGVGDGGCVAVTAESRQRQWGVVEVGGVGGVVADQGGSGDHVGAAAMWQSPVPYRKMAVTGWPEWRQHGSSGRVETYQGGVGVLVDVAKVGVGAVKAVAGGGGVVSRWGRVAASCRRRVGRDGGGGGGGGESALSRWRRQHVETVAVKVVVAVMMRRPLSCWVEVGVVVVPKQRQRGDIEVRVTAVARRQGLEGW